MKDHLITIVISVATTLGLVQAKPESPKELDVDRLIVRKELIVSDTGEPWEAGYEAHQIPRGIYARALGDGPGGLWVRSRLIKGEIDDPFDDRFHALERDGSLRRAPFENNITKAAITLKCAHKRARANRDRRRARVRLPYG